MSAKERYLAAAAEREGKRLGAPKFTVTDKQRAVAKNVIRKGMNYKAAMIAAGYSEKQAAKGFSEIAKRKSLRAAWKEEMQKAGDTGDLVPPKETREKLIRMRLVNNVVTGTDKAIGSCKLLGQDRELNLWEPENRQGIIILNAPGSTAELVSLSEIPKDGD